MKTIRVFIAVMILVLAASWSAQAQTLTTLYSFCAITNSGFICSDGSTPSHLIHGTDGNFYGSTTSGGTNDLGTIFKLTPEGTLTTLHQFSGHLGVADGSVPLLSLESGGLFYGAAVGGGTNNHGTIFTITSAGTFTTLHEFSGTNGVADGSGPEVLLPSGSSFIGDTALGGTNNDGTIFTITPAGTLTTIHVFSGTNGVADGSLPVLTLANGASFIGSTFSGGTFNTGTVFQITAGGVFTTLHQFTGTDGSEPIVTAKNGANFIGTTAIGGSNGFGTAFEMTSSGTVTTFYQFSGTNGVMDGSSPGLEPITDSAGGFYGVTQDGGTNAAGLIFTLTTSGTLTPVYDFCSVSNCADGSAPDGFIASGGNLFGTTDEGGANGGGGTVYKLIPAGGIGGGGGCTFALNLTNASPSAAGGAATVSVITSNGCAWTAVSNDGFITVTGSSSGTGNGTVHYTVAANSSTNPVSGTMTIAGNTFTVTQAGAGACTFTLSATEASPTAAGGASTVGVTAAHGCAWTAASNDGFITITSGSSGSGNGTVHYTVAANSSTNPVTGTMTIAGNTFTVNQAGAAAPGVCTFTLTPTVEKVTVKGGKKSVSVKAKGTDCTWTAVSNDSFITITAGTNGTGNGRVSFTVPGNTNTTALVGTLTIAGESVTVTQAPGGCTFRLSPKSGKLLAKGGAKTVHVTPNLSDCAWTAVSNDGFITIISGGTNILGRGVVSYNLATNATSNILTGSMTIAGQPYTVIQKGAKP
jgi:uncharacterized repeat protein (TIGR03803 family)